MGPHVVTATQPPDRRCSERCDGVSCLETMAAPTLTAPLQSRAEAFAAIALAAVVCDGQLDALEARGLRQQLEFRHPFRTMSDGAMAALLDRLLAVVRDRGCDALVAEAVPLLEGDQRETMLAVAAMLTQADHIETGAEHQFLEGLAQQLAIPAQRAAVIMEVIALLNSDSLAG